MIMSADILPRINNSRNETNFQSFIPAAKRLFNLVQAYSLDTHKIFRSMLIRSQLF